MRHHTEHMPIAGAVSLGNVIRHLLVIAFTGVMSFAAFMAISWLLAAYWPRELEPADVFVRWCVPTAVGMLAVAWAALRASPGSSPAFLWQNLREQAVNIGGGAVILWFCLLVIANPVGDTWARLMYLVVAWCLSAVAVTVHVAFKSVSHI